MCDREWRLDGEKEGNAEDLGHAELVLDSKCAQGESITEAVRPQRGQATC